MKHVFFVAVLASGAIACGAGQGVDDGSSPPSGGTSEAAAPGTVSWCSTALDRTGTVAGASLDYPSTPITTWFNLSLEEATLDVVDEATMNEAGLDPNDRADVDRFRYFTHAYDFRLVVRDDPTSGNYWGTSDLSVYLFDVAETNTPPDATVDVFDASAVHAARLSGDKSQLATAIRTTVDAMRADPRPKALIAFAPDRNAESSIERAFVNLFAVDVYFATTGSVSLSNLRDGAGASVPSVVYPLRNVRTLDVGAHGEMDGTSFVVNASCLDLQISG